jgi:protein deglycase
MNALYLFLAPGFEEIEAVTIIDILRRAQMNIFSVSLSGDLLVTGAHEITFQADLLYPEVEIQKAAMLILPGGMPGTDNLNAHGGLKKAITDHFESGKPIAAICAAPLILGQLGLLKGLKATCYPGYENQLTGAILSDQSIVEDGLLITGNGPGAAARFAFQIIRTYKNAELAEQLSNGMMY